MKRIYLGLLLVCAVVYSLACDSQPNNNNTTPNANTSPSPTIGNTNGNLNTKNDASAYGEVPIKITISDDGDGFKIVVDPEKANLSGGLKAQWIVLNNSTRIKTASVVIEGFKGINPTNTKPFGNGACENVFNLNYVEEGKPSREISDPADGATDVYEYDVVFKDQGGKVLYTLDPQIIVAGRHDPLEPVNNRTKPAASPAASPAPTKK